MMVVAYAQDKLTPGPGEVELTYMKKGTQLGIWNPQTRVYTQTSVYADGPLAGQHHQMTFNENGEVINREGLLLGFKKEDGSWKAGKIENVLNVSYMVLWNMELIGNIMDNIVAIHGVPMVSTSVPIDTDLLTFIVFCNHWGPDQINHIKKTVEQEKERQTKENAANYKPTEYRKGLKANKIEVSGNTMYAYAQGKRIGYATQESNDVVVYSYSTGLSNRIKGMFNPSTDSNGNVWGSGYIDFAGHTNAFEYSQSGYSVTFYGELHAKVGEVRQYGSEYSVYDAKGNYLGKFPISFDPRFGALFLYEFFDPK